jgi:hypothetical protein
MSALRDILRRARPRPANTLRELCAEAISGSRSHDVHSRAGEAGREPGSDAACADEAERDFFPGHLLRIVRECGSCRPLATLADHFGHRVNAGGTLAFIEYMSAAMDINSERGSK